MNTVPTSLTQPLIPDPQLLTQVKLDLPADENVDLEELEQFAKDFKQRRIKLGKEYSNFVPKNRDGFYNDCHFI